MLSIIIILVFIGFYLLYATSKRAQALPRNRVQQWVFKNNGLGKPMGLLTLIISQTLSIYSFGLGVGVFSFLVILMTVASTVVLVAPLRFFSNLSLAFIFFIILALELFIS